LFCNSGPKQVFNEESSFKERSIEMTPYTPDSEAKDSGKLNFNELVVFSHKEDNNTKNS
jgi:hypothetical protein